MSSILRKCKLIKLDGLIEGRGRGIAALGETEAPDLDVRTTNRRDHRRGDSGSGGSRERQSTSKPVGPTRPSSSTPV